MILTFAGCTASPPPSDSAEAAADTAAGAPFPLGDFETNDRRVGVFASIVLKEDKTFDAIAVGDDEFYGLYEFTQSESGVTRYLRLSQYGKNGTLITRCAYDFDGTTLRLDAVSTGEQGLVPCEAQTLTLDATGG
jgi:hypothetical protein